MKRALAIGAGLFFAVPAIAQTTPAPAPLPGLVISSPALDALGANLRDQITTLQAQIGTLQSAVNNLQTVATQGAALAPQIDALKSQIALLTQQVAALKTVQPGTTTGGGGGTPTPTPTPAACPATLPTTTLNGASVPLYAVGTGKMFADTGAAGACLPGTGTLAAGPFVMQIDAGTYQAPFDVPPGDDGFLIAGAGADKTILDGQGGAGAGHRLAWGKGLIHTRSAGTVQDLALENAGGADGKGDGEAGLYAEQFAKPGVIVANRVLFQGNEDGVYAPSAVDFGGNGANVAAEVDSSDFVGNGASKDGFSHDVYFSGGGCYVENNTNHFGSQWGNNIKVRGNCVALTGGYNAANAGRWLDLPDGFHGSVTVKGGTYTQVAGAETNALGIGEESQKNGAAGTVTWDGSTIVVSRWNTNFMVAKGVTVAFTNIKQSWSNPNGTAPSITVSNGGTVAGLSLTPAATDVMGPLPTPPVLASTAAH